MAWTTPRTFVVGEITTAAHLNTHLRDNLLETGVAKVTTARDMFYATGANALSRLAKGTADQYLRVNSGATAPEYVAQSSVAGALLGLTIYDPAGGTVFSTSSTSFSDADATNLAVTFTAPSSGKVLIRLTAGTSNNSTEQYWNLRESTTDLTGSAAMVSIDQTYRPAYAVVLTGLSAGSHTYKWGFRSGSAGNSVGFVVGNNNDPGVMEVWELP